MKTRTISIGQKFAAKAGLIAEVTKIRWVGNGRHVVFDYDGGFSILPAGEFLRRFKLVPDEIAQ